MIASIKNLRKNLQHHPVIAGNFAYYLSKLIHSTLRIKVIAHPNYNTQQQYLFAFWHGKQFLPVLEMTKHLAKKVALVSPSRDGNILEQWLKRIGYEVDRGSSRDQNVKSLVKMIKRLKQGYTIGYGVDGPVGPIYKVKPGMTYMAQKCNIPIIPLACAYSSKWVFKHAWDKYEIPKPFAKAIFYFGEPFKIDTNSNLDVCNLDLEQRLDRLQQAADSSLIT